MEGRMLVILKKKRRGGEKGETLRSCCTDLDLRRRDPSLRGWSGPFLSEGNGRGGSDPF